jgi:proline dehydrogenase
MLDMEDRSVTEFTLQLHDRLRSEGLPVAVTVQSYLHRAGDDIARLAEGGAFVRLVKGAFAEPPRVAVRSQTQIDSRFRQAVATLFSPASLAAGTYPSFATHDDVIIEEIIHTAGEIGWANDQYEFEMLYGVRPELQTELVRRGFKVRLYVPFGHDWFPYAIRRVGESPRNLRFAIGAVTTSLRSSQRLVRDRSVRDEHGK